MASENVQTLTDANFEQTVNHTPQPVLVDFWAEWCGPCRRLAPTVDELANDYNGRVVVAKMNVDENPATPMRFSIRGIPTLLLFKGGQLVDVTIGFPKLAAIDAAEYYKGYLKFRKAKNVNVRGLLAAYLADSYNAGNGRVAWRRVVAAYRRGEVNKKFPGDAGPHGKAYLRSLRKFLKKLGYLRAK